MLGKLAVVAAGMFTFGYALIPVYRYICEITGINILALGEKQVPGGSTAGPNSQVDQSRTITVEFDANAHGPWLFKPEKASVQVHPGELATVMYEFQNVQDRTMAAQAIPSYAPRQAAAHFNKLECFCFKEQTLEPGQSIDLPVSFFVDPQIVHDKNAGGTTHITLSYTFYPVVSKPGLAEKPANSTPATPRAVPGDGRAG